MYQSIEAPKQPVNDTIILRTIVSSIEAGGPKLLNMNQICAKHQAKRRGLYDFLTIGHVFGICSKVTPDSFRWHGLFRATLEMPRIRAGIETQVKNGATLMQAFDCSFNSSLQSIALSVVKLFFYLGENSLDLRQVGKLFSQGKTKYKTMLRKLYTVASSLEIAGIISRTIIVAEIKLNYPINIPKPSAQGQEPPNPQQQTKIIEQKEKEEEKTNIKNKVFECCSILSLLNNNNDNNKTEICDKKTSNDQQEDNQNYGSEIEYERRRAEYHRLFEDKRNDSMPITVIPFKTNYMSNLDPLLNMPFFPISNKIL